MQVPLWATKQGGTASQFLLRPDALSVGRTGCTSCILALLEQLLISNSPAPSFCWWESCFTEHEAHTRTRSAHVSDAAHGFGVTNSYSCRPA
jgi:hypothetical protein